MTGEVNDGARMADVEHTIRRLRDVVSARIVTDALGQIEEVHVLVDSSRNPKFVSRDVESALMSELGLRIDHRKISVAQIRDESTPAFASDRLKLLNLSFSVDRRRAEARVTLGRSDEVYTGAASAPAGDHDRLRLAAEAVADAVTSYAVALAPAGREEEPRLALREVREIDSADSSHVVVAIVRLTAGVHQQALLGSAMVGDDASWAAACATLDAVNRRLSCLVEG